MRFSTNIAVLLKPIGVLDFLGLGAICHTLFPKFPEKNIFLLSFIFPKYHIFFLVQQ